MLTTLLALVMYSVFFFVVCFVVSDYSQGYLYNDKASKLPLRVLGSALIFGGLATWVNPTFDTMFSSKGHLTLLMAAIWLGVFLLILQFEPWHAALIGIGTMILSIGFGGLAVQGLLKSEAEKQTERNQRYTKPAEPIRKSGGPLVIQRPDSTPAPAPTSSSPSQPQAPKKSN